MILTGNEIIKQVKKNRITITPFDESLVNPNSYNYRLGHQIIELHEESSLGNSDNTVENSCHDIPKSGLILYPGKVYLANTFETIGSNNYVTSLIGRSSLGRLGLFLQISADLGNLGPAHKWTLELVCIQPIKVYPMMKIGQVSFWVPKGEILSYNGKYTNYSIPKSCIYEDLKGGQ